MKTITEFNKKITRRELEYYNSYRKPNLPVRLLLGSLLLLMSVCFALFIYGIVYLVFTLISGLWQ